LPDGIADPAGRLVTLVRIAAYYREFVAGVDIGGN